MRLKARRVVVTGVGLITPVGVGTELSWRHLLSGVSGIGLVTAFDASSDAVQIAGEVRDFIAENYIGKKDIHRCDRFIQFAIAAGKMAVEDAGLKIQPQSTGCVVGVGFCGLKTIEEALEIIRVSGTRRLSPMMIPRCIPNLAAGQIALALDAEGPSFVTSSACASGAHAIAEAARLIAWGEADAMIAGGAEAAITPLGVGGFAAMRALSTRNDDPLHASRPFDRDRDGFVMAEGAGMVILESLDCALARGARIYAELAGIGMATDTYHMTQPDPSGKAAALAMKKALQDAELEPENVQYISAHGTSTPMNDVTESAAIEAVFGDHARKLAVSSIKSMIGHSLGAAGAIELGVTALCIRDQKIPPTINLEHPDEHCRLDYVPNFARDLKIHAALSNSFGFGGANICLALRAL